MYLPWKPMSCVVKRPCAHWLYMGCTWLHLAHIVARFGLILVFGGVWAAAVVSVYTCCRCYYPITRYCCSVGSADAWQAQCNLANDALLPSACWASMVTFVMNRSCSAEGCQGGTLQLSHFFERCCPHQSRCRCKPLPRLPMSRYPTH